MCSSSMASDHTWVAEQTNPLGGAGLRRVTGVPRLQDRHGGERVIEI